MPRYYSEPTAERHQIRDAERLTRCERYASGKEMAPDFKRRG